MNITIICNTAIPAIAYGGTQRVVLDLAIALNELGHKVTLLIKKLTSSIPIQTIIYNPELSLSQQIPSDTEILHFHDDTLQKNDTDLPYVVTVHGNPKYGELLDTNTIFVSKDHANRYNSSAYVYNGLSWSQYGKPSFKKEHYYHFLGNGAWKVKNLKGAIHIAKKANISLKIIGAKRFNVKMGVRFTLTQKASFYGTIGGLKKNQILDASKGFIFPIRWYEPFGLAIIESLYFGSPVFATPYGSLKELISQEVGFLSTSASEITYAIQNNSYNPKKCYEYANDCFNAHIMAKNYLKKYMQVMNKKSLNQNTPTLKEKQHKKLLPFNL